MKKSRRSKPPANPRPMENRRATLAPSGPPSPPEPILIVNGQAMNPMQALRLADQWYQTGRRDAAAAVCQAVLDKTPHNALAWHLLGLSHYQGGNAIEAERCLQRAIALEGRSADSYWHLGLMQAALGKLEDARASYQRALALQPTHVEALNALGNTLYALNRLEEAIACYRQALSLKPDRAGVCYNLGLALQRQNNLEAALDYYRQTLILKPDYPEAHNNLGNTLQSLGRCQEALDCYHQALILKPAYPEAHFNWGNALRSLGRLEEAAAHYREALALKPDYLYAHINLGDILLSQGQHDAALLSFQQVWNSRQIQNTDASGLLFALNYAPGYPPEQVYAEHRRYAERFEQPLRSGWREHDNDRQPQRRLKLGYVSADLHKHSVVHFIEPVLARHDRTHFEVICFPTRVWADAVTERLRGYADQWIGLAGRSDDEAATLIRTLGIDILVDLTGHCADNRLLVFARKPAPVQASWLGYLTTTGLTAMDYRITDAHADPPGPSEAVHSETLYRLPDGFLVFQPPAASPEVEPPPVLANGFVTFGSFNNFAKVTPAVIALWARVLHAVPGSRLLLKTAALGDPAQQERVRAWFAAHAIAPERLILLGAEADYRQHQARYHEVDIGLDPFPCNGGTTTCDALWMGVPVVTLAGDRFISRMGVSMAQNAGLAELIAATPDDYVALAARLAGEPGHLADWRQRLRPQLAASPLLDADRFTRNLEAAYRRMWQAWCARPTFGFAKAPAATPAAKPHCIQTESLRA
jgi:predicted O-linked N-acetylglucosamine transferase (SPINDLY family)